MLVIDDRPVLETYGDELCIQALAHAFQVSVTVYQPRRSHERFGEAFQSPTPALVLDLPIMAAITLMSS